MANYKLNYSGEKIDELLTKIDNLGAGTDTKSGTVKLSSATDSNSGVSDGVAATLHHHGTGIRMGGRCADVPGRQLHQVQHGGCGGRER